MKTTLEAARKSRRDWYARNPEHAKGEVKRRKLEMRAWFAEYRSSLSCIICNENHPGVLDFHHRDPSTKEASLANVVSSGWGKKRIIEEVEKCDVLCSNCHRKLHYDMR